MNNHLNQVLVPSRMSDKFQRLLQRYRHERVSIKEEKEKWRQKRALEKNKVEDTELVKKEELMVY